jgi:glycosyltransferase involved in cell wall biosynthesis
MSPKVAIITPTYQHAQFIGACVRSVIDQTESDWELAVVDDGSTDGTPDIVEALGDPRVKVIRNQHRGLYRLAEAYADALAATSAPLVAVLEGDDAWPPDKLARQLPAFAVDSVVLSYGAASLIDREGTAFARYDRHPRGGAAENDPIGSIIGPLARANFIVAATVMIRRTVLERAGGFWQPPGIPYLDRPTYLRLALEGRFAHTSRVVGNWRRHPAQFTTAQASTNVDRRAYVDEIARRARDRGITNIDSAALRALADDLDVREATRAATTQGRLELVAGDWAGARRTFGGLLRRRLGVKATSIGAAGWMLAVIHTNMEWLFRLTGRLSWPARMR